MTNILNRFTKHYDESSRKEAIESLNEMFEDRPLTCKNCCANISLQGDFNIFLNEWKCTKCGFVNNVDELLDKAKDSSNCIDLLMHFKR